MEMGEEEKHQSAVGHASDDGVDKKNSGVRMNKELITVEDLDIKMIRWSLPRPSALECRP